MAKYLFTGIILLFSLAAAYLLPGCRKDRGPWTPEVVLVMKPDSGLTTQIFDIMVDIPNLPVGQDEFYVRWDFNGDSIWENSFSAYAKTTHRFYQKGLHPIRVEILTTDGQRLTLNRTIRVDQGYSAPHVSFVVDPPESNYLTEFTFDASATTDDEDAFSDLLFRWDFEGDGVWDTEPDSNPVVKHTYKKSGNFPVKLSVTDPTRRVATESRTLVVNLHDDFIRTDFNWSPAEATVVDTLLLDASATTHTIDPSRIFTYTWDVKSEVTYGPFPDAVFLHVFWKAGMQTVTLTATDQYGLSNSCTKEFYIIKENKPPRPEILVATHYGNITTNFFLSAWNSLDDVTAPSQMLIRWDFEGDGSWDTGWSYEKVIFHQFSQPGEYWIHMEAEDQGGERAVTKSKVVVSQYTVQTGYIQDRRDEHYYGTVKIGDQWWMSDNLDYRTNPKMNIAMLQICKGETKSGCDMYGSLYQGERSAVYAQAGYNICPDGWRIPSKEDWLKLGKQIPAAGGRDAMLVGGSLGFNVEYYAGFGSFVLVEDPKNPGSFVDTVYYFHGAGEEIKFLSTTTRPFFEENHCQFYMGLMKKFDGVDLLWGDLNGYFYARCVKNE
jgi:uncharacterized protein (TIGR02145 family)